MQWVRVVSKNKKKFITGQANVEQTVLNGGRRPLFRDNSVIIVPVIIDIAERKNHRGKL